MASNPQESQNTGTTPKPANKNLALIIMVVVAILLVLAALSYFASQFLLKSAAENIIEQATNSNVDVDTEDKTATFETEEGKVTFGEGQLPENFPSDISIYENSKVEASSSTENELTVLLSSNDSVEQITDFYKDDLSKNGWSVTTSVNYGDSSVISAEKGAKIVSVTTAKNQTEDTSIAITVQNK